VDKGAKLPQGPSASSESGDPPRRSVWPRRTRRLFSLGVPESRTMPALDPPMDGDSGRVGASARGYDRHGCNNRPSTNRPSPFVARRTIGVTVSRRAWPIDSTGMTAACSNESAVGEVRLASYLALRDCPPRVRHRMLCALTVNAGRYLRRVGRWRPNRSARLLAGQHLLRLAGGRPNASPVRARGSLAAPTRHRDCRPQVRDGP